MGLRNLISCFLVTLVVVIIVAHEVSAQVPPPGTAIVTKLDKPNTVATGQPLTISVTASYFLVVTTAQVLIVAIQDSISEMVPPKPFPTTANSCPQALAAEVRNSSVCIYSPGLGGVGSLTVTFTLTAPDHPLKWELYAEAGVLEMDQTSQRFRGLGKLDVYGFQVVVTAGQIQSTTSSIKISSTISSAITSPIQIMTQPSEVTSIVSSPFLEMPQFQKQSSTISLIAATGAVMAAVALAALLIYNRQGTKLKRRRTRRVKRTQTEPPLVQGTEASEGISDVKEATTPKANSTTMFCNQCGASIPRESKFCKECGTKIVG